MRALDGLSFAIQMEVHSQNEIGEAVAKVAKVIPGKNLGIHAHNDTENAVANSLTAVLRMG